MSGTSCPPSIETLRIRRAIPRKQRKRPCRPIQTTTFHRTASPFRIAGLQIDQRPPSIQNMRLGRKRSNQTARSRISLFDSTCEKERQVPATIQKGWRLVRLCHCWRERTPATRSWRPNRFPALWSGAMNRFSPSCVSTVSRSSFLWSRLWCAGVTCSQSPWQGMIAQRWSALSAGRPSSASFGWTPTDSRLRPAKAGAPRLGGRSRLPG